MVAPESWLRWYGFSIKAAMPKSIFFKSRPQDTFFESNVNDNYKISLYILHCYALLPQLFLQQWSMYIFKKKKIEKLVSLGHLLQKACNCNVQYDIKYKKLWN